MSKASGILLILVGVGVAAYAMPSHNVDGDQQPVQQISVVKAAPADATTSAVATSQKVASSDVVPPIPKPAVRPAKAPPESAELKSPGVTPAKPTIVATSPRIYERPAPSESRGASGIIPGDRTGLTRELQRELRRVGCYDGEVNGTWTPGSRRAMKLFTDRVNASLPVNQPDYILLRLVQGSSDQTCGSACPAGQGKSADGRCVPAALVAHAAKKGNPALPATGAGRTIDGPVATTSGWSTTTTVATRDMPAVPEGRMALAGPGNEAAAVRRPVPEEELAKAPDIDATKNRVSSQRKPRLVVVDNSDRRYVPEPRKKFGPWFFRQQDTWRN